MEKRREVCVQRTCNIERHMSKDIKDLMQDIIDAVLPAVVIKKVK